MPTSKSSGRGSKTAYSAKQKRQAQHIEESEKKQGRSGKAAARIAWATVNKQDGGAKGKKATPKKSTSRTATKTKRSASKSSKRKAA